MHQLSLQKKHRKNYAPIRGDGRRVRARRRGAALRATAASASAATSASAPSAHHGVE